MHRPEKLSDEQKMSQLMDGEWHDLNHSECVKTLCADKQLRAKWERYHLIRDAMNNESVQIDASLTSRISAAIDDEPVYSNITAFVGSQSIHSEEAMASDPGANRDTQPRAVPGLAHRAESQSQRVAEQQDSDISEPGSAEASRKKSLFNTGVTGFALAASVALVTVVGMNLFQAQSPTPASTPGAAIVANDTNPSEVNTQTVAIAKAREVGADAFSQQIDGTPLPVAEFVSNTGTYWLSPESSERVFDEKRLNMMLSRHLENSPTSGREGLLPYSRLVGYDESVQNR